MSTDKTRVGRYERLWRLHHIARGEYLISYTSSRARFYLKWTYRLEDALAQTPEQRKIMRSKRLLTSRYYRLVADRFIDVALGCNNVPLATRKWYNLWASRLCRRADELDNDTEITYQNIETQLRKHYWLSWRGYSLQYRPSSRDGRWLAVDNFGRTIIKEHDATELAKWMRDLR